jgi:hypothetical protein
LTSGALGPRTTIPQPGKLKNLIRCKKCGDYANPIILHSHLSALIIQFYFAKVGSKYWSAQRLGNRFNLDHFQVEIMQRFLDRPKKKLKEWMRSQCTDDEVESVFGFEDPSDIKFSVYPLGADKWDMRYFEMYMKRVRNGNIVATISTDKKEIQKAQERFEERNRRAAREYAKHNNK